MRELAISRGDGPLLVADERLGHRFSFLLEDEK